MFSVELATLCLALFGQLYPNTEINPSPSAVTQLDRNASAKAGVASTNRKRTKPVEPPSSPPQSRPLLPPSLYVDFGHPQPHVI